MTQRLNLLKKALALLSQASKEQLEHLKNLGIPGNVDELALEYDDIAAAADDMLRQQELTRSQYDAVVALREQLQGMSGLKDESLWSEEGLTNRSEWDEVRARARTCLATL